MKVAKLVTAIISFLFCGIVLFQSCATGVVNTLEESSDLGGSAGFIVAILLLAGAVVQIVTRASEKKGGAIACMVLFLIAAVLAFANAAVFKDLTVWGGWCVIMALLNLISLFLKKKA